MLRVIVNGTGGGATRSGATHWCGTSAVFLLYSEYNDLYFADSSFLSFLPLILFKSIAKQRGGEVEEELPCSFDEDGYWDNTVSVHLLSFGLQLLLWAHLADENILKDILPTDRFLIASICLFGAHWGRNKDEVAAKVTITRDVLSQMSRMKLVWAFLTFCTVLLQITRREQGHTGRLLQSTCQRAASDLHTQTRMFQSGLRWL